MRQLEKEKDHQEHGKVQAQLEVLKFPSFELISIIRLLKTAHKYREFGCFSLLA